MRVHPVRSSFRKRSLRKAGCLSVLLVIGSLSPPQSAGGRVHWVDPSGDDDASGDPLFPLRTIQRGVDRAGAGDTVRVRAGVYPEWVVITHGGIEGSPIVVESAVPETARVIAPAPGGEGFQLGPGVHDIRIRAFRIEGPFARGVRIDPGAERISVSSIRVEGPSSGIYIRGVDSLRIGGAFLIGSGRGTGLTSSATPSYRVRVHDTVARDYDDGHGCAGDADGFVVVGDDILFERCRAIDCSEDGFDLKATSVVIRDCEASGCCNGAKLWYGAVVERSRFHDNSWYGLAIAGLRGEPCRVDHVTSWSNAASALEIDGIASTVVEVRNSVLAQSGAAIGLRTRLVLTEEYNTLWHSDETAGLIWIAEGSDSLWLGREAIQAGVWFRRGGGRYTEAVDPLLGSGGSPAAGSPCIDSADPAEPPLAGGGWFADRGAIEMVGGDAVPGDPGMPAAIEARAGWGWLDCAWIPPLDPDLAGYEIQIRDSPLGEWRDLARAGRADRARIAVDPVMSGAQARMRAIDLEDRPSPWTAVTPVSLRADLDEDGTVGPLDLALFRSAYGFRFGDPGWDPRGNLNIDGIVDALDLAGFSALYAEAGRLGPR